MDHLDQVDPVGKSVGSSRSKHLGSFWLNYLTSFHALVTKMS